MILSSGAKYNQINFSKNHVSGNARKIGVTFIWWFTFDEQFACFVVHLLTLKADECISYEKEDDIVITKKNGEKIFIQVKNSADTPVRKMTTADTDFWKTLKLWVDGYNHYTAPDKNKYFVTVR